MGTYVYITNSFVNKKAFKYLRKEKVYFADDSFNYEL